MNTNTLPKVSDLTDEQLNILVAEECGATWQDVPPLPKEREWADDIHPKRLLSFEKWDFSHPLCAPIPRCNRKTKDSIQIPRYTESLDAMHKAESSMNDCEIEEYIDVLPLCAGSDLVPKGTASFVAYFATAKQRAQAFVVAKGKATL